MAARGATRVKEFSIERARADFEAALTALDSTQR
jgi:hypothetical protein